MLNIYTDQSIVNDKRYIKDSSCVIVDIPILDTEYNRAVIENIEGGRYLNEKEYLDKKGRVVSCLDMCVTSKVLIGVRAEPTKILNCEEIGDNAGELLFSNTSGGIYINKKRLMYFEYSLDTDVIDVYLDGKHFTDYEEYYEYLKEVC